MWGLIIGLLLIAASINAGVKKKLIGSILYGVFGALFFLGGIGSLAADQVAGSVTSSKPPATTVSRPTPATTPKQPPPPPKKAKLELSETSKEYSYGYLKLVGTVKNTGDAPAFSPTVKIRVYGDQEGKLLLAEDTALIAGQFLSSMEPGVEAAWEAIVRVPGEPDHIWWESFVD